MLLLPWCDCKRSGLCGGLKRQWIAVIHAESPRNVHAPLLHLGRLVGERPDLPLDFRVRRLRLQVQDFLVVGFVPNVGIKSCLLDGTQVQAVHDAVGLGAVRVQAHLERVVVNVGQIVVGNFKRLAHRYSYRLMGLFGVPIVAQPPSNKTDEFRTVTFRMEIR